MNGSERVQEPQEIVVLPPTQTLADTTDDLIASAERRIANIAKVISLSLKITNHQDWVDQNGKPYLGASGAEKIARLFGVSWKIAKSEKIQTSDEKGGFYFYQVSGVFTLLKDSIEAVGTCSSKDQFFAKRNKELLPISEIDETNIMKAAYTNCVVNGVTRLLGLRNLTWEQVESGGEIKKADVAGVKYAAGGAGGGLISEPQQKRLFAILMHGAKEDKSEREKSFKLYLAENYKLESSKEIKRSDYDKICQQAEQIAIDFNGKF